MELASLILLVLLPPADATGDTAAAVEASLRQQLGGIATAIAPDTLVTPAMWQGEKSPMRARFVAHLTWKQPNKGSIELTSFVADPKGKPVRTTRDLTFVDQDSKTERGRAVGLVLAEMLRESPPSAWAGTAGPVPAGAVETRPSHLALGAMLAVERVQSGNWAMGPELIYDFGLSEAFRIQASGEALFSSTSQYNEIGLGLGGGWDFLRSSLGRHALGIGLEVDAFHESATFSRSGHSVGISAWNMAFGATLGGHVTVWRTLRLVGEVDLRATLRPTTQTLMITTGDDDNPRTVSYPYALSRWRPTFAFGLELPL
jgi:hypothetical protein